MSTLGLAIGSEAPPPMHSVGLQTPTQTRSAPDARLSTYSPPGSGEMPALCQREELGCVQLWTRINPTLIETLTGGKDETMESRNTLFFIHVYR